MKPASGFNVRLVAAACILCHAATVLGGVLSFPQKYQEKDQWCWAGCSQASLEFYGVSKSQTEIAQYGTEGQNIWNYLYGSESNPTRRGIDMILSYFGGIGTTPVDSALSLSTLSGDISGSKPPVLRWGWDSGGGHFIVAYGTDSSTVYIMDPWYGPTVNTYTWVCRGSSHTWTHTLRMNSAPWHPTPNPNAAYAYTYAYYGEYYTYYAYNYYYAYDYYGFLLYAYYFADYAHYYAYLAYLYDATYGNDYGFADYAYYYAYYGYLYAMYAYYYETGDTLSANAATCEYYAYLFSYYVAIGQR